MYVRPNGNRISTKRKSKNRSYQKRKSKKRSYLRPQDMVFRSVKKKTIRSKILDKSNNDKNRLDDVSNRLASICGMEVEQWWITCHHYLRKENLDTPKKRKRDKRDF